jgi:hypothetical protein
MMKDGFTGIVLILLIASSSVPIALGLAGLSKPTWLSLICRKVSPLGSAAAASPMRPTDRGIPPATVHSTPVPAQVMHSRILRRLTPLSCPSSCLDVIADLLCSHDGCRERRSAMRRGYSRRPCI